MRITKSGAIHKHSQSIQHQGWQPADSRRRLWEETRSYLIMLERFDDGSRAAMMARAACKNLFERLGEQSL